MNEDIIDEAYKNGFEVGKEYMIDMLKLLAEHGDGAVTLELLQKMEEILKWLKKT